MRRTIRISLLGDGPSDRCLLVILRRLVGDLVGDVVIESHWADLGQLKRRPVHLRDRIQAATTYYPCDVLFIHRDAERQQWQDRVTEIREAIEQTVGVKWVPVVPVRMTEAWLLGDERAIRHAADNPTGTTPLNLGLRREAESDPNPKLTLKNALIAASESRGRRLRRFQETIPSRVQRVAEIMTDLISIQQLPAFQRVQADTAAALRALGF